MWLKRESGAAQKKVLVLVGAGIVLLAAGYLWGLQFPIIKKIWTSSYVLVAAGYSTLLLALFYQVIEIWRFKKWAMPFIWIGSNAIILYMVYTVLHLSEISSWLVGVLPEAFLKQGGSVLAPILAAALSLLLAYFLHRKKLFIRL
jgi:predicted acyltransferase